MWTLIKFELFKTYAKWRTYIGFIAVGVLIPLIMWIMWIEGGKFIQHQLRTLQEEFLFSGNLFNGWVIAQIIMNGLWVHIPILIALVAGDELSGEATSGTFRLILIRPVSRTKILNAKYFASIIYVVSLIIVVAVLSVGLGLLIFGSGDLIAFDKDGITILPEHHLVEHFLFAYALAIWGMSVVASLAFFISSFVENALGPVISTMVIMFIFYIITALPVESVESIKPYLFTTHINVWQQALKEPYDWEKIGTSVSVLSLYCIGFYTLTLIIFKRKDILS